jgi:hypothetical protein
MKRIFIIALTLAFFLFGCDTSVSSPQPDPYYPPVSTVKEVVISPDTTSIIKGEHETFTVIVKGENFPSQQVTWTITGKTGIETNITSYGYLSVSPDETSTQLIVRATSKQNTSIYGTAIINVNDPQPFTIVDDDISRLSSYLNKYGSNYESRPSTITISGINPITASIMFNIYEKIYTTKKYVIIDFKDCTFQNNKVTKEVMSDIISTSGGVTNWNNIEKFLKGIILPNSVVAIGSDAFYFCRAFTVIGVPNTVTNIAQAAFRNCSSLKSITIPYGTTSLNDTFWSCNSLESIVIPSSVTTIWGAFDECTNLIEVTLPAGVTIIESGSSWPDSFPGDLKTKYDIGGAGTYKRTKGSYTWVKVS